MKKLGVELAKQDDTQRLSLLTVKEARKKLLELNYEWDSDGILRKILFSGLKTPSIDSVLAMVNQKFVERIGVIKLINTIETIENIESIDLIDAITTISNIERIKLIDDAVITQNYVRNGGFEIGSLINWVAVASGVPIVSTDYAHSGSFSTKLNCDTALIYGIEQVVVPCFGDCVLFCCWVKSPVNDNEFRLEVLYSDGTSETSATTVYVVDDWLQILFQPTTHKVIVLIRLYSPQISDGAVYVDDVSLFPKDIVVDANGKIGVSSLPSITGTVTANAGTNLNTSALALEATLQSVLSSLQTLDNIVSGSEAQVDVVAVAAQNVALGLGESATYADARIDTSTSGSNVEVVAAQGVGNRIYVCGYQIQGKGDVEAKFRSASTDISPEWDFNAREGAIAPVVKKPLYYFRTAVNEALNIYLDAAVVVTGNVQYWVGT